MESIIIVGGISRGKSTTAHEYHLKGYKVRCGDPASKVVHQKSYSTYLPEGLDFAGDNGGAVWIARNWFPVPRGVVCEGHIMSRALRRWLQLIANDTAAWQAMGCPRYPCDRIIVLDRPAHRQTNVAQEALSKGVMKVWREVAANFRDITEVRS